MTLSSLRDIPAEASCHADDVCDILGIPSRCTCPDDSGSCPWCEAYYDYMASGELHAEVPPHPVPRPEETT